MKFDAEYETIDNTEFVVVRALENLNDDEYDKIKPLIEVLGGHWREKAGGFCFACELLKRDAEAEWKEHMQFFPTPKAAAKRVIEQSGIENFKGELHILEPSAGTGSLLEAIERKINKNGNVVCIEPDETNAGELSSKGYAPEKITFEEYYENNREVRFTHVIMNPPFSLGRDINHVKMAFDLLENGGTLVAIISENTLYYKNDANREFVSWLESINASIENIPFGTFIESGTAIDTVMIRIEKKQ